MQTAEEILTVANFISNVSSFFGVHNFDQKGYKVHGLFVFEVVKDKQVKESSFQQELKECLLSILTVNNKIFFFIRPIGFFFCFYEIAFNVGNHKTELTR